MHSMGGEGIFIGDPGFEFFPSDSCQGYVSLSSADQCEPTPQATPQQVSPFSRHNEHNSKWTLPERKEERAGGLAVGATGQGTEWPFGKPGRVEGPVPSHRAFVRCPSPSRCSHTHAGEALHSGWGESDLKLPHCFSASFHFLIGDKSWCMFGSKGGGALLSRRRNGRVCGKLAPVAAVCIFNPAEP